MDNSRTIPSLAATDLADRIRKAPAPVGSATLDLLAMKYGPELLPDLATAFICVTHARDRGEQNR